MTADHRTSAATGLAEPDGRGDLPVGHVSVIPGIGEERPTGTNGRRDRPEPKQRIRSATEPSHATLHQASVETRTPVLRPDPPQARAEGGSAPRNFQQHSYSDWRSEVPNDAVARQSTIFRRVATSVTGRLRQHLEVAEPTSEAARPPAEKTAPAEGVSAFLGRVLNQLSLSAWLPAAMLVGSLAVLLQLRAQQNRNLVEAATGLANRPLGLLILLLFALILATMVTQAFEFEVIRLLEGYWGNSFFAKGISRIFVSRQRRKFNRLLRKRDELVLRAFRKTKPDLLSKQIVPSNKKYIVDIIEEDLEAQVSGRDIVARTGWRARKKMREAMDFDWKQFAPAHLMGLLDAVENQLDEYPEPYRLLPTKLGNVLRAAEDSLPAAEGDELESFVLRRWDKTPGALQREHDQYRTRLDLYCMLVFIFLVLAILAPPLMTRGSGYLAATLATSFAYLVMAFVSYGAAVASARGFSTALKAIAERDDSAKGRRWRTIRV